MPPHVQARWVPSNNGQVPPNTVEGGYQDGNKTFVGRAHHDGQLAPGEVSQNSVPHTEKFIHQNVYYRLFLLMAHFISPTMEPRLNLKTTSAYSWMFFPQGLLQQVFLEALQPTTRAAREDGKCLLHRHLLHTNILN